MLTVKASAKPSIINGIGLFADQKITKGTVIWKFDPEFDIIFDPEKVERMPGIQKEFIKRYAYLSSTSGKYILSIDDSRFTNHSMNNNVDSTALYSAEIETRSVASRDIETGEEILDNYRTFDAHDANSSEAYLNN